MAKNNPTIKVPILSLKASDIPPTAEASFWERVNVTFASADACWEWTGSAEPPLFYGRHKIKGKRHAAHRIAYALCYGEVPASRFVCHTCDNPRCCRPDHLFLGTPADNMGDRDAKGRNAHGSRTGTAILNEIQVAAIKADDRTQQEIADSYGVCKSTIGKIKTGVNWAHI